MCYPVCGMVHIKNTLLPVFGLVMGVPEPSVDMGTEIVQPPPPKKQTTTTKPTKKPPKPPKTKQQTTTTTKKIKKITTTTKQNEKSSPCRGGSGFSLSLSE